MRTKVLFFITNLAHGGAERVLVNLVNGMDKSKFDITVQTIFDTGVNKKYLSKDIQYKSNFKKTFHGLKFITKFIPANLLHKFFIKEKYDIEIAYLEGPPAKIISGCSNKNTKKLSWIHIELNENKNFMEGFFNKKDAVSSYKKFDSIVCVSETVKTIFQKTSDIVENVIVKYNTNDTNKILRLSKESVTDFDFNHSNPVICSVAKIENSKGYDRLIEVHQKLMSEGIKHRIIVLGIGKEKDKLENILIEKGLTDSFKFIGFKENPYKYISRSDLYICSSRKEGFSTAVTEALILGVPVVSTCCSGAYELLGKNNEYGIVTSNDVDGIYQGLKEMLLNNNIKKYKEILIKKDNIYSTENTVNSIEKLLTNI